MNNLSAVLAFELVEDDGFGCSACRRLQRAASGSAALDEARVQAHVSDVVSVQQPGEETLQAEAVTSVRTRPELPLKRSGTKQT